MKTFLELLEGFNKCTSITERIQYANDMMVKHKEKPEVVSGFKQLIYAQLNPLY